MSTRELFAVCCEEIGTDAVTEENAILQAVPRELLPPFARAVLDDSRAEPAPEYWAWLIESVETAQAEYERDCEYAAGHEWHE